MTLTVRAPVDDRPGSPSARRATRPSWRDPRLAVGVLLVCGSVLGGAKVLDGAEETVAVLATPSPLVAGQELDADDLVAVELRFTSQADADRYLPAAAADVDGSVLLRPVGAGELVPRAALGVGSGELVELPLAVEVGRVPSGVRAGSEVDVWVASGRAPGAAERLLSAVPVLAASRPAATGPNGLRQVVVGVPASEDSRLARVVSRLGEDAGVLLVRRPG